MSGRELLLLTICALLITAVFTGCMTGKQANTKTTLSPASDTANVEYPELEPLTADAEQKLKEDFAAHMSSEWRNPASDKIVVVKYYGTYNGHEVVVMYNSEYAVTDDMKYITVGGYTFALSSGCFNIDVHVDSDFIDINNAYKNGYLTDSDIAAIDYYAHNR